MDGDWRLNGQEKYLFGAKIVKVKVSFPHPDECDHQHCEFCWAKFSDSKDDFHDGYAVWPLEELIEGPFYGVVDYMICPECFSDFKEMFQWVLLNEKVDDTEIIV